MMGLAMAATSGLFLATKQHMRRQNIEIETNQAARSVADLIIRDLRLGGACLPVTGQFISLEGSDDDESDEITTRTGLTRPDLSCVRSTTPLGVTTPMSGTTVQVQLAEGFKANGRAFIHNPSTGTGEYFTITSVDTTTNTLGRNHTFAVDYPENSGVYAIDERRFFLDNFTTSRGVVMPVLKVQIGDATPQSFAVGIEKLDIEYMLNRDCPPCDTVDLPNDDDDDNPEWRLVEQVFLTVTARSELKDEQGDYFRTTMRIGVKPRNLLPR